MYRSEVTAVGPVVSCRQYTDHVWSSLLLLTLSVVSLEQGGSAFILDFASTRKHGGGQVGTRTGKRTGLGGGWLQLPYISNPGLLSCINSFLSGMCSHEHHLCLPKTCL